MKTLRWLNNHFEGVLLTAMLLLLTLLVMLQITMRYLFNSPLSWSEELCKTLLVWSGFFSIGYCARKGSTIQLDTVVVALPPPIQRILKTLTTMLMAALLCFLFKGAWNLVIDTAESKTLMAGLQIPLYWLYVGPLLGIGLGVLRFLQVLIMTKCFAPTSDKEGC